MSDGNNEQIDGSLSTNSALRMQYEYFIGTDVRRKTKDMAHL